MKAVKILILCLLSFGGYAQTVTPNPGPYQPVTTKYQWPWGKLTGGLWNLGKLVQVDSAQFSGVTYVPNAPDEDSSTRAANTGWTRRWIAENVTPGTPDIPAAGWGTYGTYGAPLGLGYYLGTKDSFDLPIKTNGVLAMNIAAAGLNRKGATGANKMLIIDTATRNVSYADVPGGGGGSGTVTDFSAGNFSPLFTTGVANSTTTPALSFSMSNAPTNTFLGRLGAGSGIYSFIDFGLLDSTNNSIWHSEGYWNGRFAPIPTTVTLTGSQTLTNKTLTAPKYTVQTLTDGATITMDIANGNVGTVTLGGNRTLAFSNLASGHEVKIFVTQDGTGGRTLTLPASTKVINGGAGAVTLSTAAGSVDILTFTYVGTTLYCNYGKNYN